MPFKSQNIFLSRDPLVDEPLRTDMADFEIGQDFLTSLGCQLDHFNLHKALG